MPRRRPRVPPPLAESTRRPGPRGEASVLVRLTAAERDELRAAAEREERPLGAWVRRVALRAAREPQA